MAINLAWLSYSILSRFCLFDRCVQEVLSDLAESKTQCLSPLMN